MVAVDWEKSEAVAGCLDATLLHFARKKFLLSGLTYALPTSQNADRLLTVGMLLSVRTLDGKAIPVEVQANETVLAVKKKIQQIETIRVDLQRLVLNNVQLNNHQKLSECAVDEDSILYLVLRNYPSLVFL